ncbi:protein SpAN [Procambarus clarkii]|uniref:protein SpAN n=1 Tax=Procambarus clarkii TaxID=6728 RepID=UPI003743E24F
MKILVWWCLLAMGLLTRPSLLLDSPILFGGNSQSLPLAEMTELDVRETSPEVVRGQVFEGDMLLTVDQWQSLRERKGLGHSVLLWPDGPDGYPHVPYVFNDDTVNQRVCLAGMRHWMTHTCIKFSPTTDTDQPHLRFIYGDGCYSSLGRVFFLNGQDVSMGSGCDKLETIAHALGHAVGFVHEHSRSDRDDFVHINQENIIPRYVDKFTKTSPSGVNNFSVAYDYTSLMHYKDKTYTINGKPTIVTLDPLLQGLMGQSNGLSHRDKLLANKLYNCIGKWLRSCNLTTDPCENEGYLGANCGCVCPPGTSGIYCQDKIYGYYGDHLDTCSEMITEPGTITSPNYPRNYDAGVKCVKWIVAPECYTPSVSFSFFRISGQTRDCDGASCCYAESLEIRTSSLFSGDVFCGREIVAGNVFNSSSNQMILYFQSSSNVYKGWSANVTFELSPECQVNTTNTTSGTQSTSTTSSTTSTTPVSTSSVQSITNTDTSTTSSTSTTLAESTSSAQSITNTDTSTTSSTTSTTPVSTSSAQSITDTDTSTTSSTTSTTPESTSSTQSITNTDTRTTPNTPSTTISTTTRANPSTTTTTTTTTSTPPQPDCSFSTYNNVVYYFTSPNLGVRDYPNNFQCRHDSLSDNPSLAKFKLVSFHLQDKPKRGVCRDYVTLHLPYGKTEILCGQPRRIVYKSPTFSYGVSFQSDESITRPGFNISITRVTSPCHRVIRAPWVGSSGIIQTPGYLITHTKGTLCEWWITAPRGSRVRVDKLNVNTDSTTGCQKDWVVLNTKGNKTYPVGSSQIYCGTKVLIRPLTSKSNKLFVAYYGRRYKSKGMKLKYTVI